MAQSICSIDECDKPVLARTWCSKHYARWHRDQDPHRRRRGEVIAGCRICPRCEVDTPIDDYYTPRSSWCRECEKVTKRQDYAPTTLPLPAVYCVECGARYRPSRRTDITCSKVCASQRGTRFNRITSGVNRALRKAAFVETVVPEYVFETDAWICQICHTDIDPTIRWPDPRSASVDHIKPLNRGGDHSYANCQSAHLGCNAGKCDRVPA